jgi:hypothetical protein
MNPFELGRTACQILGDPESHHDVAIGQHRFHFLGFEGIETVNNLGPCGRFRNQRALMVGKPHRHQDLHAFSQYQKAGVRLKCRSGLLERGRGRAYSFKRLRDFRRLVMFCFKMARTGRLREPVRMSRPSFQIAATLAITIAWCGTSHLCLAQAIGTGTQSSSGQAIPQLSDHGGGVLEIAPRAPVSPPAQAAPSAASTSTGDDDSQQNPDDQGSNDDVELYKANANPDEPPSHGPLPYLGIAVHSTTVVQPNGERQLALEVLSVDANSPAAAAGIKGSGSPTKLGASSLTATALLGPAQGLLAPLLQKTGQLGTQGDLIVAADDNRVGSEDELAGELARLKPGDTLWLTVLRESAKGQPKAVKVPIKLGPPQSADASTK